MNILIVTQEDYLAGSTYSVSYLATGLARRGHHVYVGARPDSLLETLLQNTGVTFLSMTFRSRFSLSCIREMRDVIMLHRIELINAQSSKDRYISIFTRWAYRLPVSVVHTRRQYPRSDGGSLQRWFYTEGTDAIIAISHELKNILIKKGYRGGHIRVIQNGIPAEKYTKWLPEKVESLKRQYRIAETDLVVGCVSRLKKQDQIIRALVYLQDLPVKVLLVGVEPGYFDVLVRELGIRNEIIYAGFVDGAEVLNYYRLFTVNILASITDGFGLVLLEAMAMGCPVIATNFGGIRDVVKHNWNGLLFDDNDIVSLACHISAIANGALLCQKLIENGFHTAFETFSMDRTLDDYELLFSELIARNEHETFPSLGMGRAFAH